MGQTTRETSAVDTHYLSSTSMVNTGPVGTRPCDPPLALCAIPEQSVAEVSCWPGSPQAGAVGAPPLSSPGVPVPSGQ